MRAAWAGAGGGLRPGSDSGAISQTGSVRAGTWDQAVRNDSGVRAEEGVK